mgnify:CR=1 FL=1
MPQIGAEALCKDEKTALCRFQTLTKMIEKLLILCFPPRRNGFAEIEICRGSMHKSADTKVGPKNTLPSGCLRTGAGLLHRYDDPLFKTAADPTLLSRHDRFYRSHSETLYLLINCARVHAGLLHSPPKRKTEVKAKKGFTTSVFLL